MRKDITISNINMKEGVKINISETARKYNCCWRTIDRRIHPEKYKTDRKKREYKSNLDSYKELINEKLEKDNIPATGIYSWLKISYDYKGSYSTVKKYVSKVKKDIINNLTIRFNTIAGYQSQVDWKESMSLADINGVVYKVNIFLIVLGYSRYKYIELTTDREQHTLFKCLTNAFNYFDGITETILFDNMKTVVDRAKSDFKKVVLNTKIVQYAKDANFEIHTCRAYKPNTKGKVETLAKVMNRLKAFNTEFSNLNELNEIVKKLMYELNYNEKSQATNEIPCIRHEKEKEYLTPVNIDLLKTYYEHEKTYKVSHESMIQYKGIKYSVPTYLVGQCLSVKESDEFINIYCNTTLIHSYKKCILKQFNYKKDDYVDILKQSVYKEKNIDEIEDIAINNIKSLDDINIG